MAQRFFAQVLRIAEWQDLISDDHFTVDGTQVEAWASMKSFVKKDGSSTPPEGGGRNPTVDFKGGRRSNMTHHSSTDRVWQAGSNASNASNASNCPLQRPTYLSNENSRVITDGT